MKGIILAGGLGTRLYPLTGATSKQLLPVYDKPMIYYPLSVLMQAKIFEILIISTRSDLPRFQALFKDGAHLGLKISYKIQENPGGIAEAFLIAEDFIGEDSVCLILGDNIFYGPNLEEMLDDVKDHKEGAVVFTYHVQDPTRYGVVAFDEDGEVIDIIEKPKIPPSPYAVTGLYFYDNDVISIAKSLQPSARGELEITDVNKVYLERKSLRVKFFGRGFAWLDTGTFDALYKASSYVQTIQERQGIQIACIEEIAYKNGWIDVAMLKGLAKVYHASTYGSYLEGLCPSNDMQLI
ncbi:glucose-1-phosphate thymidylyltransferase [Candidatus Aerophobetes bacterium]|uniref:Glucose-1-phosphate thymidylyltransferase n=1 Tax=Aerophobetes bacterium TaxID=2030807 RepID=A0A2A4Y9W0_UNCAE|nr:MAG: glucose-1-phosphate thymidylyltransferase [Candidatus Aerophobetes bacterium]